MSECPAQIARQWVPAQLFMDTARRLEGKHVLPSGTSQSSSGKSLWAAQKPPVAPAGPCWSCMNVLVLCWTFPLLFLLPLCINVCTCPNHSCPFLSLNPLSRVTKALPSILHLLPFSWLDDCRKGLTCNWSCGWSSCKSVCEWSQAQATAWTGKTKPTKKL